MTKRTFVLCLLACCFSAAAFQSQSLPRDLDKLFQRAQDFWILKAKNQLVKAADFVLPEKREKFLNNQGQAVIGPAVSALEFSADPGRVRVKTTGKMIVPNMPSGLLEVTVTDTWMWMDNNWFVDVVDPDGPFQQRKADSMPVEVLEKEFDQKFKFLTDSLDFGTVLRGSVKSLPVRFQYSGDVPVRITPSLNNGFMDLERISTFSITSKATTFPVVVDATGPLEGPFDIAFGLNISYKGASIKRSIAVRGSIFSPLSIRQSPEAIKHAPGAELQLFVRNNTDSPIRVAAIHSDAHFGIVELPGPIASKAEGIVRMKELADSKGLPEIIGIQLEAPVLGRNVFEYRLRIGSDQ